MFLLACCFIRIMRFDDSLDCELEFLRALPLVVVEGKKDSASLKALGVKNVVALNRRPLYEIVDSVSKLSREAALLVDLDSEGKKLYAQLSCQLRRCGVRVNDRFRRFLFRETSVRHIEGIASYYWNIHAKGI